MINISQRTMFNDRSILNARSLDSYLQNLASCLYSSKLHTFRIQHSFQDIGLYIEIVHKIHEVHTVHFS